jgi:hypothetical protein
MFFQSRMHAAPVRIHHTKEADMRNEQVKILATSAFLLALSVAPLAHAESAGQYIDDATITTKVKAALLADSQLKATQVSVQTNQGVVQLGGTVDSKGQESEAVHTANTVDGVKQVNDQINIRGTAGSSGSSSSSPSQD